VFFGKFDPYSIRRMPTYQRKWHVEWTLDNLATIYGGEKHSTTSETKELTEEESEELKARRQQNRKARD
jgi:hypothetical protein